MGLMAGKESSRDRHVIGRSKHGENKRYGGGGSRSSGG